MTESIYSDTAGLWILVMSRLYALLRAMSATSHECGFGIGGIVVSCNAREDLAGVQSDVPCCERVSKAASDLVFFLLSPDLLQTPINVEAGCRR